MKSIQTSSFHIRTLALALATLIPQLSAASPIHSKSLQNESEDVTVPLSQTDVETTLNTRLSEENAQSKNGSAFDLSASSWQPRGLVIPSQVTNPSAFGTSVPTLSLGFLTSLNRDFNWKLGLSFMTMDRSGNINIGQQVYNASQTAYLGSVALGMEYQPKKWSTRTFSPLASVSLLPTFVMTSQTDFDDGTSQFGVPVEFQLGTLVHLLSTADLNVGVNAILGKANDSNLSGVGINAGVRFAL